MSLIILIMFSKLTLRALSFIAMSLTRGSRLLPVVRTVLGICAERRRTSACFPRT